jgi:hypothetical protein
MSVTKTCRSQGVSREREIKPGDGLGLHGFRQKVRAILFSARGTFFQFEFCRLNFGLSHGRTFQR